MSEPKKHGGPTALIAAMWSNYDVKSYTRANHWLQRTLALAIRAGLKFEPDEILWIYDRYRGHYWFGAPRGEWVYAEAIVSGNASALRSVLKFLGRKRFLHPSPQHAGRTERCQDGSLDGSFLPDALPVLRVGDEFQLEGERLRVTSFNDEHGYLVAVIDGTRKIRKFTPKDLKGQGSEADARVRDHIGEDGP